jgi:hypothetical protein
MDLQFVQSESTFSYFGALESYLLKHGRPVAFYSDKHTVFRVAKPSQHMTGMTQFGRALAELNIEPDRLAEVFCLRDQRHVTKNLMLKYDRKRIKLEINDLTRGLVGKYVDVYEYGCGRIQVRANGVVLPHSILNPERKITHAAITENKRLSAVLEHIKTEQDKAPPKVKVKPVSAKNGYVKTGRRPPGGPSKMEPYYARKRAEREARAASQSSDI